jgi:hypothetical protein
MSLLLSLFLSVSALPSVETFIEPEHWIPVAGDRFIVDTKDNVGYLVHESGDHTSFKVVTGQKRNVYYIGRYYNAKTPDKRWRVQALDTKAAGVTFGPTGRFLRLFDSNGRTAYGIHGHKYAEKMLSEDVRFRSMGCVIVSEEILDVIEFTYYVNGESLNVETLNQSPLLHIENLIAHAPSP